MDGKNIQTGHPLQAMYKTGGRRLGWWQVVANSLGACIVTSYFVFFDRVFPATQFQHTFYVVAVMFPFLVAIAAGFMHLWQKDLILFLRLTAQDRTIGPDLRKSAQRKILDLPLINAAKYGPTFSPKAVWPKSGAYFDSSCAPACWLSSFWPAFYR